MPPTAERRAQVQNLRTLGIVGTNQKITASDMKTYDNLFATPILPAVLSAIAALVDRDRHQSAPRHCGVDTQHG